MQACAKQGRLGPAFLWPANPITWLDLGKPRPVTHSAEHTNQNTCRRFGKTKTNATTPSELSSRNFLLWKSPISSNDPWWLTFQTAASKH